MSFAERLQSWLPQRDPRTPPEIDSDLEEEFAFHLDALRERLREEGMPEREADRAARQQFGDIERIRRKCRWIALKERIMLQRINLVMMIIVLLAVIGVSIQVLITQRYNTLALQAIVAEVAANEAAQKAEARERARAEAVEDFLVHMLAAQDPSVQGDASVAAVLNGAARRAEVEFQDDPELLEAIRMKIDDAKERASRVGIVELSGAIPRPGTYSLPAAGWMTLSRIITAAGARQPNNLHIQLRRPDKDGAMSTVFGGSWDELIEREKNGPVVLQSGDYVNVEAVDSEGDKSST